MHRFFLEGHGNWWKLTVLRVDTIAEYMCTRIVIVSLIRA